MTVQELIAELQQLPPDLPVLLPLGAHWVLAGGPVLVKQAEQRVYVYDRVGRTTRIENVLVAVIGSDDCYIPNITKTIWEEPSK